MPYARESSLSSNGADGDDAKACASPSTYLGLKYPASPRTTPKSVSAVSNANVVKSDVVNNHIGNNRDVEHHTLHKKNLTKSPLGFRSSPKASPILRGTSTNLNLTKTESDYDETEALVGELIGQISRWLHSERAKLRDRQRRDATPLSPYAQHAADIIRSKQDVADDSLSFDSTELSADLDKLESILEQAFDSQSRRMQTSAKSLACKSSTRKLGRKPSGISSDTDYVDGAPVVPSAEVVLKIPKPLKCSGRASGSDESSASEIACIGSRRNQKAEAAFKVGILKLAHTLGLKRWRRMPLDMSSKINVQRLSGALTNAVYVVSPPSDFVLEPQATINFATSLGSRKAPPKLLLRIYGPNVEHLINRKAELAVLGRLARKRIGPRLLGTFINGRFEEYFHARPLAPDDLRDPQTSQQIAKRMRELHDGIDLLPDERESGPFVWQNWGRWVNRVEKIARWLDAQIEHLPAGIKPTGNEAWKRRGYICGVPWPRFRDAVEKYRNWLESQYRSPAEIMEQLVFSHNDTQYGNILRMVPSGDSPLLLPENSHKTLVVIDFEYANANLPGLEFANHFTEWCYDYDHARKPYACKTERYPTPVEQERFVRAYVRHRHQFNIGTPHVSPEGRLPMPVEKRDRPSTTSIADFMLDARSPSIPAAVPAQSPEVSAVAEDSEVSRLIHETRIWRLANTAQWVAWGIVQAKVPGMPDFGSSPAQAGAADTEMKPSLKKQFKDGATGFDIPITSGDPNEEGGLDFDYLGYAQHRAMFFWGDAVRLGLVNAKDLPEKVQAKMKTVPY